MSHGTSEYAQQKAPKIPCLCTFTSSVMCIFLHIYVHIMLAFFWHAGLQCLLFLFVVIKFFFHLLYFHGQYFFCSDIQGLMSSFLVFHYNVSLPFTDISWLFLFCRDIGGLLSSFSWVRFVVVQCFSMVYIIRCRDIQGLTSFSCFSLPGFVAIQCSFMVVIHCTFTPRVQYLCSFSYSISKQDVMAFFFSMELHDSMFLSHVVMYLHILQWYSSVDAWFKHLHLFQVQFKPVAISAAYNTFLTRCLPLPVNLSDARTMWCNIYCNLSVICCICLYCCSTHCSRTYSM